MRRHFKEFPEDRLLVVGYLFAAAVVVLKVVA